MEILSRKLEWVKGQGRITCIKAGRRCPAISHLFLVDDALLFFKPSMEVCRDLRKAQDEFCVVSREVVSAKKSFVMFSPNTPSTFVRILRKTLGMASKCSLGAYLGCPMDVDGKILVAIATHILALYLLPRKILGKISSMCLKLFWEGVKDKRPIYWRKREVLERHKSEGGLGLRNVQKLKQAMVLKQAWKVHDNRNTLMSRLIVGRYGLSN
ncbi:uncharacterized protein LOC110702243 [Chenopodium quinoa]|uniref:uncharacterized protein LOC110702243 n=1 Tax=Chenopodium quinoa TaxID=63459 RepID=UPI000B78B11A|nr:uncharacterized protein LOC110702243 [Chenopodium quinoa]